jgi:hypothetical protein
VAGNVSGKFEAKESRPCARCPGEMLTMAAHPTRVERHRSHIIELSPREYAGRDFGSE